MEVITTKQFKRDIKRVAHQGRDLTVLIGVVVKLALEQRLDRSFDDHSLSGDWIGWNECHLSGDWLLIYRYQTLDDGTGQLELSRTGSHSQLFNM